MLILVFFEAKFPVDPTRSFELGDGGSGSGLVSPEPEVEARARSPEPDHTGALVSPGTQHGVGNQTSVENKTERNLFQILYEILINV